MDEDAAIYFRFSSGTPKSENVSYLVARLDTVPRLSLGEIIVFLGYHYLTANNIQLRNFSDPSTARVATDYHERFHQNPALQEPGYRRVQPERNQEKQRPPGNSRASSFTQASCWSYSRNPPKAQLI